MNKEYVLSVNGEEIAEVEVTAAEEESAYANIKEEAASFPEALQLAWQGWLGIFVVAFIIIAVTSLLNAVTSKKKQN